MSKKPTATPSVSKRREEALRRKQAEERQRRLIFGGIAVAIGLLLAAFWLLSRSEDTPTETAAVVPEGDRALAGLDPAARNDYFTAPPTQTLDTAGTYEAVIQMAGGGTMRLRLFGDEAPLTVNNFIFLADQGFYDGTTFHRVLDGFMAQGGDPTGTGLGGPGYQFADETGNGLTFDRPYLLAMANAGPNTNGSQFFITYAPTPHLDGAHTIFGELVEGQDVLEALTLRDPQRNPSAPGDVIESITIERRS
jgi:peptidylprolyl isomerase